MSDDAQDPFLHDPQAFERMLEHFGELARQDHERLATDKEHLLLVMRSALDSLVDDNDPASAEVMLRTCLGKYGRLA
jgi:hypothetical protein